MRPLLVGEMNPYGADPRFALYPRPPGCAGSRLCFRVMELEIDEYLTRFDRTNLCVGEWVRRLAVVRAREIEVQRSALVTREPVVLLGARVCEAFGVGYAPVFRIVDNLRTLSRVVVLPHPSGRCRVWNDSASYGRARGVLREAGVLS